ncbi:MAG: hypothetical protein EBR23_03640 [Planctomycetia bacterium]|nr:hypothetical protein [Planctomycetia bacterium]
MMHSFLQGCVLMVTGLACWTAAPATDDRVVDAMTEPAVPADNVTAVLVNEDMDDPFSSSLPAERMFDAAVFAAAESPALRNPANVNPDRFVGFGVTRPTGALHDGALPRLAGVRREGMKEIDLVTRICRLGDTQRHALELALQSDLRRVAGEVDTVRDRYVGASAEDVDPRAFQSDVEVCRQVIATALGSGSLLARVAGDMLDPQVRRHWQHGRRECRWRATVAAVLEPLDESLGLSSSQYAAVEQWRVLRGYLERIGIEPLAEDAPGDVMKEEGPPMEFEP